jgi:site-specific DNA-methyltransferase (adenine-specific)
VTKPVIIGDATLYLGDCRDILPTLGKVDAVITDPPYSARCHSGHDAVVDTVALDGAVRAGLGYAALTAADVAQLSQDYSRLSGGWIVWMTDSNLALIVRAALEGVGRYAFAPLPFYQPGRSVRLTGDGPCSWTDWIVVARTKAQIKWGTLPGGYIAGPGWSDKEKMGGKPTALMELLVTHYSRPGDLVLDSHMGAGTTGVACVRTGRKFIGIEVDAVDFDIACKRIEQAAAQGQLFQHEPQKQTQASFSFEDGDE